MTRNDVRVAQSAMDDLRSAARYIALTLENPKTAEDLLGSFDGAVDQLESVAYAYPNVRDEVAAASGYCWIEMGNYMVFFRVIEGEGTVIIERIAYKKRNWARLIK